MADRLPAPAALAAAPIQGGGIDAIAALAETRAITDMLHRRVAIMLPSPGSPNGNLRPAHRDIGFSLGAMAAQAGLALAECDPNLLRHLAARLDIPLLAALRREFGAGARWMPASAR